MFEKEFYPTPDELIETMIFGVEVSGKFILEPSAGKGNIVDHLKKLGAKNIITFEKNDDLRSILTNKCSVIGKDFFDCKPEMISHVNLIIMNPPFSNADKHILHAWTIAPEGCEIVALCNAETVLNGYTAHRNQLNQVIKNYGTATTIKDSFSNAERKTDVEIALIRLFKPATSKEFDYEGFFMDQDDEVDGIGIMPFNEIRSIVNSYIGAVKCWDEFQMVNEKMNRYTSPIGFGSGFEFKVGYDNSVITKESFSKEMQKKSWSYIFSKMNLNKYVTSGVMQDINKFVETQSKYPFTMKNVYKMFEIIIGTREQTMNRALEEVFDKLTMHYKDNRYHVEGWATNSHYLVNKKFILEGVVSYDSRWDSDRSNMKFGYDTYSVRKMNDLNKALSYLMGVDNGLNDLYQYKREMTKKENGELIEPDQLKYGKWFDWGFFEMKGYMKGTLHVKFKDENVWATFNRKIAEIKGFPLPEKI